MIDVEDGTVPTWPIATFELGSDFRFVAANSSLERHLGAVQNGLIGQDGDLVISRLRGADLAPVRAAIHGTGPPIVSLDTQLVRADNTSIWVTAWFEVDRSDDRFCALNGQLIDASEQRAHLDELDRINQWDRRLHELSSDLAAATSATAGVDRSLRSVGDDLAFDGIAIRQVDSAELVMRLGETWTAKPARYDAANEPTEIPIDLDGPLGVALGLRSPCAFDLSSPRNDVYPVPMIAQLRAFGFKPHLVIAPIPSPHRPAAPCRYVLCGVRVDGPIPTQWDLDRLERFAAILSPALHRTERERSLSTRIEIGDNLPIIAARLLGRAGLRSRSALNEALSLVAQSLDLRRLSVWEDAAQGPGVRLVDHVAQPGDLLANGVILPSAPTTAGGPVQLRGSESSLGWLRTKQGGKALAGDEEAFVVPMQPNGSQSVGYLIGTPAQSDVDAVVILQTLRSVAALIAAHTERLALTESFGTVVRESSEPSIVHTSDGQLLVANDAFRQLVDPGHLIDLTAANLNDFIDNTGIDDTSIDDTGIDEARAAHPPRDIDLAADPDVRAKPIDLRFRNTDGQEIWARVRTSIVRFGADDALFSNLSNITAERVGSLPTQVRRLDELTGLANRRSLIEKLERTIGGDFAEDRAAVLLFDIDRFKVVNDSLGHYVGDDLLRQLSQRLKRAVRPGDFVARLGGDEFVVVMPGPVRRDDAIEVAERLHDLVAGPVALDDHEVFVTLSIGIAFPHRDDHDVSDVLRHADSAMYEAKALGPGRYHVFDQAKRTNLANRSRAESELRSAIAAGELVTYYQPEYDLTTRQIVGVEALARWPHPTNGLMSADDFIPVAEATGLIRDLGSLVLHEACSAASRWRDKVGAAPFKLRVNMSAVQLDQYPKDFTTDHFEHDMVSTVRRALAASGLPASALCLELTETALMQDPEKALVVLDELVRDVGVSVAVDDFGTGFSSLAYLRRLPVKSLKIDREFVDGMTRTVDGPAIVSTIVTLAQSLRLEVVAEGIEDELTVTELLALGVNRGQGFYLSKPLPHYELDKLLFS